MSTVKDADGNVLNRPPLQIEGKYLDEGTSLVQDWHATHPSTVDEVRDNPPYEDENGKTWLYNPETKAWDIPALVPSVDGSVRVEDVVTGEKTQDGVEVKEFSVSPTVIEQATVEFHVSEVPATLPEHSGETLVVVDSATTPQE